MARFRILFAIWLGKLTIRVLRLLGRGGSNFPGRLSLLFAPRLLSELSKRLGGGVIMVTATNGKTTTTRLLAGLIREAGLSVVTNASGANMCAGLVTALVAASSAGGGCPENAIGVLEVDEGSLPKILPQIRARYLLIGNFFPDQLDRYGDSLSLVNRLAKSLEALPTPPALIANADDPLVVRLADREGFRITWCGLGASPSKSQPSSSRPEFCPRCQASLSYSYKTLAQLGDFHCQECGFSRPQAEWRLEFDERTTREYRLIGPKEDYPIQLGISGAHFLYNSLLALTALGKLGLLNPQSLKYLKDFRLPAGREEEFEFSGRKIALFLVKNPVGAQLTFGQIAQKWPNSNCLLVFNNFAADGRDLAWIYQAEFEDLVTGQEFFTAGRCANRLALRLSYAGARSIRVESKPESALKLGLSRTPRGQALTVIASYTALAPLKRLLAKGALKG